MMRTSCQQLPVELWLSIFSYLELHDLRRAFSSLNHYFEQLIASDYLLFHLRLGKTDRNPLEYSNQPYVPPFILNRIITLQEVNHYETSHIPEFLRWHYMKLIQLKSLKVRLRGREMPVMRTVIPQLHLLRYLSVTCVPNQILFEGILASRSIRVCRLDFQRAVTPIHYESSQMSNIEILFIKLQDDLNNSIINLLLKHMPKLKQLEIHSLEIYFDNRDSPFGKATFRLPELRTLKINWSLMYCDPNFFHSLHDIMPNLMHFDLNILYYYLTENFFDSLICHWWPMIEDIQQMNVFIQCPRRRITIDHSVEIDVDKFQETLLAMNDKYKGRVRLIWTEKMFVGCTTLGISICKS